MVRRVISRAILREMYANENKIGESKESILDENIPSEFLIELNDSQILVQYKALLIEKENFRSKNEIGILAPVMRHSMIPVQTGMGITMRNIQGNGGMMFETVITAVDGKNGIMYVRYTDEAKILHSQKNFSVAPKQPIAIQIACPSFNDTKVVIEAKILEMSRVRMVLFCEQAIPEKECLSIFFQLPGEIEISSPLVIARKRKDKYMYDIEFAVIDEREQTKLVQYMYKRQIELARGSNQ